MHREHQLCHFNGRTVVSWECLLDGFICCALCTSAILSKEEKTSPTSRSPQTTCRLQKTENYLAVYFFICLDLCISLTLSRVGILTHIADSFGFKAFQLCYATYVRNMEAHNCRELETVFYTTHPTPLHQGAQKN